MKLLSLALSLDLEALVDVLSVRIVFEGAAVFCQLILGSKNLGRPLESPGCAMLKEIDYNSR